MTSYTLGAELDAVDGPGEGHLPTPDAPADSTNI